ncbi:YMGG-like glycine zipper-containing protein [Ancylobacter sp. TS-1]|uniref:YMGG-like glycine zipper-containing protein n=1 Tax=Ancylobacter sp. TS-1 TaxID=1850374 RepID=UPI001265ABDA|nr:YMGG-like glycine zipper-containing protein [Ancylobacter sp. TS-1]QFR31953.1 hypothetical protein GBB76_01815 [Ancylobacter sp. TS-1]
MSKSIAIKLSAVAIVALVAAGCTTTERRVGTGALIGAGTGAVIGGIAGGGTGAAWGAGIGAVAGGAIGAATAK